MRRVVLVVLLLGALAGCGEPDRVVHLVLGGDVSFARFNAGYLDDASELFAGLERELTRADLVAVNLESPLVERLPADPDPLDLRAAAEAAPLLESLGVDVVNLANNHAGDGGEGTIGATMAALAGTGVAAVGAGDDLAEASAPLVIEVDGTTVGWLGFDVTGVGPPAGEDSPGVVPWDMATAEATVAEARERVDVLVVSLHGGVEYLAFPDVALAEAADALARWGVDVVWGHGAHVPHDVAVVDPDADDRQTLVATGLGNLVFDQSRPGTEIGLVVEVLAGPDGVTAHRVVEVAGRNGSLVATPSPEPPAVLIDGAWWHLGTEPPARPGTDDRPDADIGDVMAAALGDADDDGADEWVISFRRPRRPASLHQFLPATAWVDGEDRTAHVGVFDEGSLTSEWVASAVSRPISDLVVCDGAVAVLRDRTTGHPVPVVGGWTWNGFGFDEGLDLAAVRPLGCVDVDGDGRTDPVAG